MDVKKGRCFMEKITFKLILKPGKKEEYKKAHDNIWPEMLDVLKEAGIKNYTIWNVDDQLFGYYEVEDKQKAFEIMANSETVDKWNEKMKDIYYEDLDPETGNQKEMELMFEFDKEEV